jgi:muramoyltetrapeptide carboxypeptidase
MKKTADQPVRLKSSQAIVPPPVFPGDTVGLIAPAGSITNENNLKAGLDILRNRGFKVKYSRSMIHSKGYLAGSDQKRALEFNNLWSDPEVKGLVAARGGYGSMRMIDLIDMKRIRKNPKILIGFSDLTVLLTAISRNTGLVTYHGPVVTTLSSINKKSQTCFFKVLEGNVSSCLKSVRLKILRGGNSRGILLGGNLTTLVHTIGTPYEIPWHQAILFIEDIGESPYRLDRLLTHLALAGRLKKIKGLILGSFTDDDKKEKKLLKETVQNRVLELLAGYDMPIWTDFPIGHGRRNITLPIGTEVLMDSRVNMLKFI